MFKGIVFNEDADHYYHFCLHKNVGLDVDIKELHRFIDQYKDTDITDFMICENVNVSSRPSKVMEFMGDQFLLKEKFGKPVDYSGTAAEVAYNIWVKNGIDMYKVWIDRLREDNIRPWISVRMNDAHYLSDLSNQWISKQHVAGYETLSRVRHRQREEYFDLCRDWAIDEVRNLKLEYIKETFENYDIDGIELDFMRELFCFAPGQENRYMDVITEFVGKVRDIANEFEKKYCHKIKIAVRANSNPVYCVEMGFDILEWARRGYINMFTAAPRFDTTENNMPIKLWKEMLMPYNVEVCGCVETLVRSNLDVRDGNNLESALGTCANILSQGADKVYLFNYMEPFNLEGKSFTLFDFADSKNLNTLFTTAGDLEKIQKMPRKNIVTYNDSLPRTRQFEMAFPIECGVEKPLRSARLEFVRIVTGYIGENSDITLRIGIFEDIDAIDDLEVYVNCEKCEFLRVEECGKPHLTNSRVYCFKVPNTAAKDTYVLTAELYIPRTSNLKKYTLDYTDITIN